MLEQHLQTLTQDLGIPPLEPKDKDSWQYLVLMNNLRIACKEKDSLIFLVAQVGCIPTQKKEDAFIYFMKANLLGQGTGEQYLGIDLEEKFLTLSCSIPYEIKYNEFKEKVEDFANYLAYWHAEIEKLKKAEEESLL